MRHIFIVASLPWWKYLHQEQAVLRISFSQKGICKIASPKLLSLSFHPQSALGDFVLVRMLSLYGFDGVIVSESWITALWFNFRLLLFRILSFSADLCYPWTTFVVKFYSMSDAIVVDTNGLASTAPYDSVNDYALRWRPIDFVVAIFVIAFSQPAWHHFV